MLRLSQLPLRKMKTEFWPSSFKMKHILVDFQPEVNLRPNLRTLRLTLLSLVWMSMECEQHSLK